MDAAVRYKVVSLWVRLQCKCTFFFLLFSSSFFLLIIFFSTSCLFLQKRPPSLCILPWSAAVGDGYMRYGTPIGLPYPLWRNACEVHCGGVFPLPMYVGVSVYDAVSFGKRLELELRNSSGIALHVIPFLNSSSIAVRRI